MKLHWIMRLRKIKGEIMSDPKPRIQNPAAKLLMELGLISIFFVCLALSILWFVGACL